MLNQDIVVTMIDRLVGNEKNNHEYLYLGIVENKLAKLIEINSSDFIKKSYVFSTTEDNQDQIIINLFRGENEEQSSAKFIGQYQIVDIPKLKAEEPKVEISFFCNNGVIGMHAMELNLNLQLEIVKKIIT